MYKKTTVRKIGNALGVTIPKSILEQMNFSEGDSLYLVQKEDGLHLTPYDPDFADMMRAYQEGAKQYRNALHELAK
jgi:putative addiction module antidote